MWFFGFFGIPFFVESKNVLDFMWNTLFRLGVLAVVLTFLLSLAYMLSELIIQPRWQEQDPTIQLSQKILLLTLGGLGIFSIFLPNLGPGPWRILNWTVWGLTLVLACTLVMSWARGAFPIGGQEIPVLLKLAGLVGVTGLVILGILQAGEFLGGKFLVHALGVAPGYKRIFLFDLWKVMLPWVLALVSLAAGTILLLALRVSLLQANWFLTRPHDWLFPSPTAFLILFLMGILSSTWWGYFATVNRQRALMTRYEGANPENGRELPGSPEQRTRHVRLAEYFLGTREWNQLTFHRLPDDPHSLGFPFPGFLVGVEKASRNLIGVPGNEEVSEDKDLLAKARQHGSSRFLSDRKRTFVSHVVEFSPFEGKDDRDCRRDGSGFGPRFHFNLYGAKDDPLSCSRSVDTAWKTPEKAYDLGFSALRHLGEAMETRARMAKEAFDKDTTGPEKPYTHVLVLCMGWNTDQQEAIRNYNSLRGYLKEAADRTSPGNNFKPMIVGITWPSQWAGFLPASYPAKADDADETGMVWGSYLVHNVLAPLKESLAGHKCPVKVVLVGHSFGTRVLTRAMASDPAWIRQGITDRSLAETRRKTVVDLFVGLQGAFSIDRFVDRGPLTGGGQENAPYRSLLKTDTRFIFTWSKEDKANPLAAYVTAANHIGGTYGADLANDRPEIFIPVSYHGPGHETDPPDSCRKADANGKIEGTGLDGPPCGHFRENGWEPAFWSKSGKRILMVNMSRVVVHTPYGKGGKAHSDIYKYQIGHFLWKTLEALDGKFAGKPVAAGPQAATD